MNQSTTKNLYYIFFTFFILLHVFLILFGSSPTGHGGIDNVSYYQLARYSFKHSELLPENLGEPLYTVLLAPFAQFGFKIAKSFNLILSVLTLLLSVKIANRLYSGSSFFIVVLIAFSPAFFLMTTSCLPWILIGFLLMTGVYFFIQKRYIFSVIILSFLPLVDSAGFIILSVFVVFFILNRSYRVIPYLFAGSILYFVFGYFFSGDILWLSDKFPNPMEGSVQENYGFLNFIITAFSTFEIPLFILVVTGIICWLTGILKNFSFRKTDTIFFILIACSWLSLFMVYAFEWWKNPVDSENIIWKMAGIIPLAALTVTKAFEFLSEKIKNRIILYGIFSAFALLQILLLFTQHKLIVKTDTREQLIEKSANFIRFNEVGKKVSYFDPLVVHYLEIDPFDTTQCVRFVAGKRQPSNNLKWGDVLVWDAYFGPNEGDIHLNTINNDPYLKKLETFFPQTDSVKSKPDYNVQVFKKSINKNDTLVITSYYKRILSFEDYLNERVKEVDGFKVWELDSNQEFSPTITLSPGVVKQYKNFDLTVNLNYRSIQPLNPAEVLLVFSAENEGKNLRYEKADLITEGNKWEEMQLKVKMPASIPASSKILIYIWNKDRKHLFVENITVEIESS